MAIFVVGYDLIDAESSQYERLRNAISYYPNRCWATESMWFINTSSTPLNIYKRLSQYIYASDHLYVVECMGGFYAQGDRKCSNWLKHPVGYVKSGHI